MGNPGVDGVDAEADHHAAYRNAGDSERLKIAVHDSIEALTMRRHRLPSSQ
jgi:hypothetical protein